MGQGRHVGEADWKTHVKVVGFSEEQTPEQKLSASQIADCTPAEAVRETPSLHWTTASARQSSNIQEIFLWAFDIAGSVVGLLVATPIMLVVAVLIRIICGEPVLYRQKRVGKDGKIFTLYKFRTMINNAEDHTGPIWAAKDDPRVTRIGRILRRKRLDELPQLFNVIRGDMSLVGPRPERPHFVNQHEALQGVRLAVKPGLTGLAQIRSIYALKPEHKRKYDQIYIQNRSMTLNLYILLMTVPVVLFKDGW